MTAVATLYAPAERATPDELAEQRRFFSDEWFFGELLHYVPDMVMILNGHRQVVYANRAVLEATGSQDLASVVGQRPGELLRCKHSHETPGGCGTTSACRYCGAVNAVLTSQAGRFAVEEWRLTVERNAGEAALDLKVWASPMQLRGQRFTFLATVFTLPFRFSMGFVEQSVRYNAPETPSRMSVSVSSIPSRIDPAAPGWSLSS